MSVSTLENVVPASASGRRSESIFRAGRSVDIHWLRGYVDWLEKLKVIRVDIHAAPRLRRLRSLKRCTKVMRKKGFSAEFIGVAMEPFFVEKTDPPILY